LGASLTSIQVGKGRQRIFSAPLWLDADRDGIEAAAEIFACTLV